jgi:general secretion pathway protein L
MANRSGTSYAQIHLSEHWPEGGGLDEPPVRWALRAGSRVEDGVGRLRTVPPADEVTVVVPCSRLTFVRALLPRGPASKLAKLAPFAIEDAIAPSPDDVRTAVLDDLGDGERLIVVLDRHWFERALEALGADGATPDRVIIESALAVERGAWTVVWNGQGGFAALGSPEAIALDASIDGRPPLALKLAADERRGRADAPERVRVLLAAGAALPDLARWSASLHLPVVDGGRWQPELVDARRIATADLLAGAGASGWRTGEWLPRMKPVAIAAAVVFGVHAALTTGDWMRLRWEAGSLTSAMDAQFRKAFPDAKSVVDPALQMSRNVAGLRRAAGEPDPSDVLPLLARVAPALGAAGLKPQSVKYERGQVELELAVPAGQTREALAARLRVPGVIVRVERVAGPAATVRLSAEGS